jgi:replication factor A1
MGLEKIVNQILSSRSDIKREQILQIIENRKKETGNFLTDETAARIVATELGVKIAKKPIHLKIQIKDIVSGLSDVSLTGKVVSVFPPKTFKRRDWTEGKLANIIISDETGTLRVILWDNKADFVEKKKIQRKQTIKISHGYVREGQDGKPELHLGDRGNIKILTKSIKK